jgi:hypothetical protein
MQLQSSSSSFASPSISTPLFSSPEIFGQQPITPWTYQPPLPPLNANTNANANLQPKSDVTLSVPLQINQEALKKFQADQV